jgi:WD40 repeat-containing protein SMU1
MTPDGERIYSVSSDGTIKIWDVKSSDCTDSLRLPSNFPNSKEEGVESNAPIHSIQALPNSPETLAVSNRSPVIYFMNLRGDITAQFHAGMNTGENFITSIISPKGGFLYGVTEDNTLYCFSVKTKKLEHMIKVRQLFSRLN